MSVNGHDLSKLNAKAQSKFQPAKSFEWDEYLKSESGVPAPSECFNQNVEPPVNEFEIKHKLEITSPDNADFVHLATVVNYIGCRLQLRLDGCDNSNDIFELVDSDSIHAVGAHQLRNKYFAAPLRFRKDAASYSSFCQQILKNAVNAPDSAFKTPPKPPPRNLFQPGMKLEAVDVKHASNIWPATVASVDRNHIFIELDGWDSTNGFKASYLSRNLFPVGWCKKTGHLLQHPGPKVEIKKVVEVKKEVKDTNSATSTPNNYVKSTNQQSNNNNSSTKKNDNDDKATLNHIEVKQSPKPVARDTNSLSDHPNKPIIGTVKPANQSGHTSETAINTITITTTTVTPTTPTTVASKLSNSNIIPKLNNDHSIAARNINHKNQKGTEHPKSNIVLNTSNVINNRNLKRPYEQIDYCAKNNANVIHATYKSIVPNSVAPQPKVVPHVKSPLQLKQVPQHNSIPHSKLSQQSKSLSQTACAKQANFTLQPRTVPQPSVTLQLPKPVAPISVNEQSKSSPHSSSMPQSKLTAPVNKPFAQSVPQPKFTQPKSTHATNVPVVNGSKASPVLQYKTEFPSSKAVSLWSVEEVIQFLNLRISEFSKFEQQFRSHEIDGKAFLLLTNEPIMKFMHIKLGLSLKICNIVDRINGSNS